MLCLSRVIIQYLQLTFICLFKILPLGWFINETTLNFLEKRIPLLSKLAAFRLATLTTYPQSSQRINKRWWNKTSYKFDFYFQNHFHSGLTSHRRSDLIIRSFPTCCTQQFERYNVLVRIWSLGCICSFYKQLLNLT